MARIADKHGLTNRYRPIGEKRNVKRGRPRKYLFGAPKRKSRTRKRIANVDYSNLTERDFKTAVIIAGIVVGVPFLFFIYLLIRIVLVL